MNSKAIQQNRKEVEIQWGTFNWKVAQRRIYKLQKRIYQAAREGRISVVRKLQNTLIKSFHAKMLAVRKVAQINQGKKTAGVDGVAKLTSKQKLELALGLKLDRKAQPAKRVWLPKPGKDERRPLGIPTMEDRAKQALLKMAIEPEWEAKFEETSYGFRPGRGVHDAIDRIYNKLFKSPSWILDADIKGCFDNIDHTKLLDKAGYKGKIRQQIKTWLKAGLMDFSGFSEEKGYNPTTKGTPQGGIISPLLANIALHGLTERLDKYACQCGDWIGKGKMGYRDMKSALGYIRYADDFLIIHPDRTILEGTKPIVEEFLNEIGLILHPEKTKIVSSRDGVDFLGHNIRHYNTGKYRSISKRGEKTGYTMLVKPSKKAEEKHYAAIRDTIRANKSSSQEELISKLNPKIRGWCNFYRYASARDTFHRVEHNMFLMLWKWAKGRHKNKGKRWIAKKYWHIDPKWIFSTANHKLVSHTEIKCGNRRTRLKDGVSVYDGNIAYWSQITSSLEYIKESDRKLLKKQKGKCTYCGHDFLPNQRWEKDHIIPKAIGGKERISNYQLLHEYCH
ncbi:MAG: group II intron reverse transcriptase/maturase [Microcoleaceae cyanobacterium MO_207.B10]|nr:group II intron reverse transcriptase/maturase [Microcoleaceae cyanobacterium MO_207.B10]